jgi:hypothetical protein
VVVVRIFSRSHHIFERVQGPLLPHDARRASRQTS